MKITDLKCAVIGEHPIVRVITDEGIYGYGQVEFWKPYLKPQILDLKRFVIGMDPTDVERVMSRIRYRGAFKPWGSAVSAVEMALWDIAGKAAGLPVYKLLGGKVRDRVRTYNGGIRFPFENQNPDDYARDIEKMMGLSQGFSIIKQITSFHSPMAREVPDFHYGEVGKKRLPGLRDTGMLTEKGLNHAIACVSAMKEVTGDKIGLALDCGPGWTLPDAKRFARAVEPMNILWLEDMLTGDQVPYVNAQAYRDLTQSTTTPIHTGEQIYLRQNFKTLIESQAVSIIGPDPCDVGGIAELKRVAEYADIYGIQIAPHGTANGLFGLAALIQVCATLPDNFVAFEYPAGGPEWWHDIVEGLPNPTVTDGFVDIPERPGMGVDFVVDEAKKYLSPEDVDFFE